MADRRATSTNINPSLGTSSSEHTTSPLVAGSVLLGKCYSCVDVFQTPDGALHTLNEQLRFEANPDAFQSEQPVTRNLRSTKAAVAAPPGAAGVASHNVNGSQARKIKLNLPPGLMPAVETAKQAGQLALAMCNRELRPQVAEAISGWSAKGQVEHVREVVGMLTLATVKNQLHEIQIAPGVSDVTVQTVQLLKLLLNTDGERRGPKRIPYTNKGVDAKARDAALIKFISDLVTDGSADQQSVDRVLSLLRGGDKVFASRIQDMVLDQLDMRDAKLTPLQCGAMLYVKGMSTRLYQAIRNAMPGSATPISHAIAATEQYAAKVEEVVTVASLTSSNAKIPAAAWSPLLAALHALRALTETAGD
jgi:hypothetical protein